MRAGGSGLAVEAKRKTVPFPLIDEPLKPCPPYWVVPYKLPLEARMRAERGPSPLWPAKDPKVVKIPAELN